MRRLRHFGQFARHFLALESAGGIVMIAAAAVAMILANSSASDRYDQLLAAPLFGHINLSLFTKDVLMAIFFFAVGMELKCEMREGALAEKGQKILPLLAALGGIIVPALLYLGITHATPHYQAGWAIPTATDIAFALCILRLAGSSVPQAAKIFLLAIAIYDDLAAILIIAFFYSSGITLVALTPAVAISAALLALNRLHVCRITPYLLLGMCLWWALHHAGIHPTVAGVITGIAIPMRTRTSIPMLAPLLHRLHPAVAFGILPLFAFTSAGVDLRNLPLSDLFAPLPMGIALALFVGKQLGIFGATFAAVTLGISPLPSGIRWPMVYGVAVLAGIGFTMSLFIGSLAFPDAAMLDTVKLGVLGGSLISSVWGIIYLRAYRTA